MGWIDKVLAFCSDFGPILIWLSALIYFLIWNYGATLALIEFLWACFIADHYQEDIAASYNHPNEAMLVFGRALTRLTVCVFLASLFHWLFRKTRPFWDYSEKALIERRKTIAENLNSLNAFASAVSEYKNHTEQMLRVRDDLSDIITNIKMIDLALDTLTPKVKRRARLKGNADTADLFSRNPATKSKTRGTGKKQKHQNTKAASRTVRLWKASPRPNFSKF